MNIETIRTKYKQILQQSDSQDSQDEWELAYSRMQRQRKKHILKDSNIINQANIHGGLQVLQTKQKLAQTISDIKDKDHQIQTLKKQNQALKKRNQHLSKQLQNIIVKCEQHKAQGQTYKHKAVQFQKQISSLKEQLQSYNIDKQLMLEQVHFYQHENQKNRIEAGMNRKHQQQLDNIQKKYNSVINENEWLRKNIKSQKKQIESKIENKKLNIIVSCKKKTKEKNAGKDCITKFRQMKAPYYFHKKHQRSIQKSIRNPNFSITEYQPQKRNKTISFVNNRDILKKSLVNRKKTTNTDKSIRNSQIKELNNVIIASKQNYAKNSVSCKPFQYFSKQTTEISENIGTIQLQPTNTFKYSAKENYFDNMGTKNIKRCVTLCQHIINEFKKIVLSIETEQNKKKTSNYKKIIRLSSWMCEAISKHLQDILSMI